MDVTAQLAQRKREQAGRGHAVDVEVTEDGYGLVTVERGAHALRRPLHARNEQGVRPVALERGCEEATGLVHVLDTARGEGARDEG